MQRATKGNLKELIIEAIDDCALYNYKMSGVHIRKAPEYLMNVNIVRRVCETFDQLSYRLEMPVKEMLKRIGIDQAIDSENIRDSGKFDIVLLSRKSLSPRHVIEVKRSLSKKQLCKEARRIASVATENHGSQKLTTGFIAAVTRVKNSVRSFDCDSLIENRIDCLYDHLGGMFNISCDYRILNGEGYGFDPGDEFMITVFELGLKR